MKGLCCVMSYSETDLLEQFADECAENLSEEDIEYLKLHIAYFHHHFEYGLYLRNKYSFKIDFFPRDLLSYAIYIRILPKVFPELGSNIDKVHLLTDSAQFSEVCACYYIKNGIFAPHDFSIDHLICTKFNHTNSNRSDAAFEHWFAEREKSLNEYIFSIADSLWNYESFKRQAISDGISSQTVDELYSLCTATLSEKEIFIPLELAYYSNSKCMHEETEITIYKYMSWFLSEHSYHLDLLPQYVFNDRTFVANAVSINGHCLKYAPKFKNDREIVEIAAKNSPESIQYADDNLRL